MCLDMVKADGMADVSGTGYVVMIRGREDNTYNSVMYTPSKFYRIGQANRPEVQVIRSTGELGPRVPYVAGFHVWVSEKDARDYARYMYEKLGRLKGVVVRVTYRGVMARGSQAIGDWHSGWNSGQGEVVVVALRTIIEEVDSGRKEDGCRCSCGRCRGRSAGDPFKETVDQEVDCV